jgi:branched-chain amino acid transport system permease protein
VRSIASAVWVIPAGIVFVVWSALTGSAQIHQSTTWVIYGLLALSLSFVWGKAGTFSFAQAAFFGIGAYAYSLSAGNLSSLTGESLSSLVIAVVVAALISALLGYVIFYGRLGDLPTAVVTLAFSLVLMTILGGLADPVFRIGSVALGGYNGIVGTPLMVPGMSGRMPGVLTLVLVAVVAAVVVLLLTWQMRRPFGRVLVASSMNTDRSELLGYNVRAVKLRAFTIGGAVAGLAGALYAGTVLYIDPSVFGLSQAALVIVWVMVGGRTSFLGAFVGVLIVEPLTSTLGASGGDFSPIILGSVLIVIVLLLPGGIVPSIGLALRRLSQRRKTVGTTNDRASERPSTPFPIPSHPENGASLEVTNLNKRYGGLQVTDDLSLTLPADSIHSIIGPNGAGKSTFLGLVMGYVSPENGSVMLDNEDVTRLPTYLRARRGLALKRQIASVYLDLSVRENLWIAAYAGSPSPTLAAEHSIAVEEWLGLSHLHDAPAGTLAHGHRQLLEIGMALSTSPRVLLLDEPTAGMTTEETRAMAELIKELSRHLTVIVVEHDMQFIRDLEAPVTVLSRGAVLTSGSIDELRSDERVLSVYLGRANA